MAAGQLKPNLDALAPSMKGNNVAPATVQSVKQLFEQVIDMSLAACVKSALLETADVPTIKAVAMKSFDFGKEPVRDFENAGQAGDTIIEQLLKIREKVGAKDEKGQLVQAIGGASGLDKMDWLVERALRAVVAEKLITEKEVEKLAGYAFRSYSTPASRI